jgi:hypothetical protein
MPDVMNTVEKRTEFLNRNLAPARLNAAETAWLLGFDPHQIRRLMVNGRLLNGLNLYECYRVFRSILLKFRPKPVPQIKSKDEALCYAEKKRVPVFRLLANCGLGKKQIGRLRNVFTIHFFREFKVDWQKLLPQGKLPPVCVADKLRSPIKYTFRRKPKARKAKFHFRHKP